MTEPTQENRNRPQVYESAIDLWIAALIFLGPAIAAGLAVYLVIDGRPAEASILFLTAAITLVVTIAMTMPCRYTILEDALSIRCGLICYQVALDEIRSVERTASFRSAPALSMRRLMIVTDGRNIIVSPKQLDEFRDQLNAAIKRRAAPL